MDSSGLHGVCCWHCVRIGVAVRDQSILSVGAIVLFVTSVTIDTGYQ